MRSLANFLQTNIIERATTSVIFASFLLLFASCAKEYYPKQFPPVQSCPNLPVVMYGGEEYPTVLIENRCWMAKNMNIGIMIGDTLKMTDNGVIEKYCYDGDTTNCKIFGGLYQWDEAMQYKSEEGTRGICPEGWHIPTNREFVDLFIYADNYYEYLIENRDTLWKELEDSENYNLTGFSAIPAGESYYLYGNYDPKIYYYGLKDYTVFWCSKEMDDDVAIYFRIPYSPMVTLDGVFWDKENGFSIRCIKDE
jgi:uncharacterized protein (TIGR02145 family)